MSSHMTNTKNILVSLVIISTLQLIHTTASQSVTCSPTATECHCPNTSTLGHETCIFNCTTEDSCKSTSLYCRAGDPCEIRCESKAACAVALHIHASTATHVTLICNGEDTCKASNALVCGTGDCRISCHGEASCQSFGSIDANLSHSFQCDGQCDFPNIPNTFHNTVAPTLTPTLNPTLTSEETQSTLIPTVYTTLTSEETHSITLQNVIIEAVAPTTMHPTSAPSINMTDTFNDDIDGLNFGILTKAHPLYYVIIILLVSIFFVCCILFCWVYLSHSHTQDLIKEQQARIKTDSVNFNSSTLNIPNTASFNAFRGSPSFDIESNMDIVTPTHTGHYMKPRMHERVNSGDFAAELQIHKHSDTKSHQIANPAGNKQEFEDPSSVEPSISSRTPHAHEGLAFDEKDCEIMTPFAPRNVYHKTTPKHHCANIQNFSIPPPPPLPVRDRKNAQIQIEVTLPLPPPLPNVPKFTIPPPPQTNLTKPSQFGYTSEKHNAQLKNTNSETVAVAQNYNNSDSSELSDDTIMRHLTMEFDLDGEDDTNSMRAVRHNTIDSTPHMSPQIQIQIKSANGVMTNIDLKNMANFQKEIIEIAQEQFRINPPQIAIKHRSEFEGNENEFERKIGIEIDGIDEDDSKSLRSFSLENTPRPKEYSQGIYNEESVIDEHTQDRYAYAIKLVGIDEPTFTGFNSHSKTVSTVVEDTYLKYLNL